MEPGIRGVVALIISDPTMPEISRRVIIEKSFAVDQVTRKVRPVLEHA